MSITIDPCQVTAFTGTVTPANGSYEAAADAMTSFSYGFEQVNACGYAETYEVTNVPTFVTHNAVDKDFTVFTKDLDHVGSHTITIISTI